MGGRLAEVAGEAAHLGELGTALHFAGRYDEAVKAYDRALSFGLDPTVPLELVVRNTALALVRLRRYEEARCGWSRTSGRRRATRRRS